MDKAYLILVAGFLVVIATAGIFAFFLYQKMAGG